MATQVLFPIITKEIEELPFFVTGIGMEYEENGVNRENGASDYQWLYCLEGEGLLEIGGESYRITPGTAFFLRKHIPHVYKGCTEPWKTEWITFNGSQVETILKYVEMGDSSIITIKREAEVRQKIREIFYTLNVAPYMQERTLMSSGQLYHFLIFMQQMKTSNQSENSIYTRLRPVINYMSDYYQMPITLEVLADQIGVTKYYLCRLFKEAYKSKPFDYLNQIRIQKAKEYLVTQEQMKIKEVGEAVGFNDTSYFGLKFKEYEGCSPLEFKRKYNQRKETKVVDGR